MPVQKGNTLGNDLFNNKDNVASSVVLTSFTHPETTVGFQIFVRF